MSRYPILVIALVALLCGCVANSPHRTDPTVWSPSACQRATNMDTNSECRTHSIEKYSTKGDDYHLAFVEFDDQGWFYDPRQADALYKLLQEEGQKSELLLFVYVHGWQHNANYCDDNVCCFRDLMREMHEMEATVYNPIPRKQRRVVGIYLGWRGRSIEGGEVLQAPTFWARKNAATKVALGSAREVLSHLRVFYDDRHRDNVKRNEVDRRPPREMTRLITLGHSFGGLVVYNAVSQALVNSAVGAQMSAGTRYGRFGDLVVLVNPAFEGTRYEVLHAAAAGIPHKTDGNLKDVAPPLSMIFTAKNDTATGKAFPVGRHISQLFDSYSKSPMGVDVRAWHTKAEEREANLNTVGHIPRYQTHKLAFSNEDKIRGQEFFKSLKKRQESLCVCSYADQIRDLFSKKKRFKEISSREATGSLPPQPVSAVVDGSLTSHTPFQVLEVDDHIVDGHNGFYSPAFLYYLQEVINKIAVHPATP